MPRVSCHKAERPVCFVLSCLVRIVFRCSVIVEGGLWAMLRDDYVVDHHQTGNVARWRCHSIEGLASLDPHTGVLRLVSDHMIVLLALLFVIYNPEAGAREYKPERDVVPFATGEAELILYGAGAFLLVCAEVRGACRRILCWRQAGRAVVGLISPRLNPPSIFRCVK